MRQNGRSRQRAGEQDRCEQFFRHEGLFLKILARRQHRNPGVCASRLIHVGLPFSPIWCVGSLPRGWHCSGICRITKASQRLIAEVAERRESGAFFYEVTLPSRMLIPSFANSKTEGTFPEELALRGSPATLPRSRGAMRPSCARVARPKQRARGKPGARRTRGRAWCVVSTRVSHHRFTGSIRLSPRNGFNGFLRALLGDRACLSPSSTELPLPT